MNINLGEIAALGTAVCYSTSSIFFTQAGKRYGSLVSNRLRLIVAILLLGAAHWVLYGVLIPDNAGLERWLWLGSSGIIGLAIGDLFLFQTYIILGPRLGLLFLSLSPAIATLLAWLILGETLTVVSLGGIALTLAGIAWVVLESNTNHSPSQQVAFNLHNKGSLKGIGAGMLAATGQATGMVLAKNGLAGNFPPLSGNVIRFISAFAALWLVTIIQGQAVSTIQQAKAQKRGMLFILGGSFFGPLIGVSLSLFAIQNTNIGIASTIISLPPIFLLPVSHFILKEKISWKAVAGTFLAIAGVGLLIWL